MATPETQDMLTLLASGLIHEIKNPLSTLDLNLQLLAEEWAEGDGDRERRSRKKIGVLRNEVRRLETILNDFLRYAKSGVLHLEEVDLAALARDVLAFVGPDLVTRKVRSWLRIDEDLPRIQADPALLKQALLNLVVNARDAMSDGGELIIQGRRDGQGRAENEDAVVIEVLDTGAGIRPEKLDKIFDLYYSSKPHGTGLGLATTRRIIEQHGGSVEVESEEGMGSRFLIRLPRQARPPAGPPSSSRLPTAPALGQDPAP